MNPRRSKFQNFWNPMKPMPLHRALRSDFRSIFVFSKNGHRMQKLLRFELFLKHAKQGQSQ
jgi:hypothetical protein